MPTGYAPVPKPVPTDREELTNYLRDTPHADWDGIGQQLGKQLGSAERAGEILDKISEELTQERRIKDQREALREALDDALEATRRADNAYRELIGLYDVEYAEGGAEAQDLEHSIRKAARALRIANLINEKISAR